MVGRAGKLWSGDFAVQGEAGFGSRSIGRAGESRSIGSFGVGVRPIEHSGKRRPSGTFGLG